MNIETAVWDPALTRALVKSKADALHESHGGRMDTIAKRILAGNTSRNARFRRAVSALIDANRESVISTEMRGEGKNREFIMAYATQLLDESAWVIVGIRVRFRQPLSIESAGELPVTLSHHCWQRVAADFKTATPAVIGAVLLPHAESVLNNPGATHTATESGLVFWTHDAPWPVATTFIARGKLEPRNLKLWQTAMETQS